MLRADSEILSRAQQLPLVDARSEVRLLLERALGVEGAVLLAHPERISEARAMPRYVDMLERRARGEPIAYILGEREFYGLPFEVTPDVLIPRPETELLVDVALEHLPERTERRLLDLGTGSGCIAITLARLRREIKVIATDASKAALAVAARNISRHAAYNVELRAGSWYEPVAGLRFDVIISNPPYIAESDPHLAQGDLRFEPGIALSPGNDGLGALRAIVAETAEHLNPGGWLLLEHGHDQAAAVANLMRGSGFAEVISRTDLAGIGRVAEGRLP
jgi:release factor glutamine methyltransferase